MELLLIRSFSSLSSRIRKEWWCKWNMTTRYRRICNANEEKGVMNLRGAQRVGQEDSAVG